MARAAASTMRSCVASLRPGAVRLIYDEHHKRVSHGAQASPVLRSFEPVLHTQKACRDRQASLVTAHFREQSGRVSNYFSCQLLGLCHVGAHASHPRRRAQRREASWELTEMRELLQLSALVLRRETNSAGASVIDA